MIDWTKPIETTEDRTPARVLGLLSLSMASSPLTPDADGFEPMMVWVQSDQARNGGWGNIFLINNEGYRCDDRSLFSTRQKPFIRNAPVKRVGWGRVTSNGGLPFMIGDVVFSEKASAEAACQKLGGIPAFITWEE